jgi:hypothetical protein
MATCASEAGKRTLIVDNLCPVGFKSVITTFGWHVLEVRIFLVEVQS